MKMERLSLQCKEVGEMGSLTKFYIRYIIVQKYCTLNLTAMYLRDVPVVQSRTVVAT